MTPVRPGQHLVLATFVMLAAVGTHRAAPLYPNPVSDTGGQGARDLAVGDFNGDGHLDAAVASDTSKDVSILLGVGDGTFGPATHYLAGQTPLQIVAGDFNADNRIDLAVLGNSPNGNVLLGLGDGTFNPVPVPGLAFGVAIAAGDLDNDGRTDLVVIYGQFSSGYYVKFISQGNGAFSVSGQNPTVSILGSVTVADVDRDGMNDLVIGAYQTIAVHRGVGGGQFASQATYATAFWNYSVQVADMNLDGRPDLVSQFTTQSPTPGAPQGFVHIMLSNLAGGFTAGPDWATGIYPRDLVVADFDADGKPDVAAAGQGGLAVLRGQSGGALSTARTYGAGGFANGLAAGDLNGDGRLDAVVASLSGTLAPVVDGVYGFLGMADGTFGQPRIENLPFSRAIVRGDFDEDGHADFAVLVQFPSPQVSIVRGNGDGSFGAVQTRAFTGTNPLQMVAADFNHDGHLDVAVSVDYAAVVMLGTGTGGLGAPVTWSVGDAHTTIAVGDLNEDGHSDLVLNNRLGTNVSIIFGVGDGTFVLPSRYVSGNSPEGIAVGDVDGDGRADLVVGCRQSTSGPAGLSYLRNLGNYAFAPPVSMFWGGTPGPGVAIADLNGDGHADLLAWGDGSDAITLFLGQGGGAFGPRMTLPSGDNPVALKVADVTGDGRLDLVVADGNSTDIAVFQGDGNGGFAPHRRFATLPPLNFDLGDFNEDGAPDVAVATFNGPTFLFHRQVSGSGNPPVAVAGLDIVAECSSPAGAAVPLNGSGSTDPDSTPGTNDDIVTYEWFEDFGTPTQVLLGIGVAVSPTLTFGTHDVTLRVRDSAGLESTDDLLVVVRDTTPPALSVTIVPSLWPPNHRLVPATAQVTAIDACGSTTVTLVGVVSSEPDDAPGGADGQTTNDIQGTSPGTADFDFLLRAERSSSGPGRTYDATYRAIDESGNVALVAGHAFVPHDIGGITDPVTITLRETPSGTLAEWGDVAAADSFAVAVGEVATLKAMDPSVGNLPPSCLVSGLHALDTAGYELDAVPDVGTAWFFVVSYVTPASGFGAESAPYDIEVVVPSDICP